MSRKQELVTLFCVCRQPNDPARPMLQCDTCQDWFHGECVHLTTEEFDRLEEENVDWSCPSCHQTLCTQEEEEEQILMDSDGLPISGWTDQINLVDLKESVYERLFVSKKIVRLASIFVVERHVLQCKSVISENTLFFKCLVKASMKKNIYSVTIALDLSHDNAIKWTHCDCVAGTRGECKHVLAVFFYIKQCILLDEKRFPEPPAPTEIAKTWHAKKSSSDFVSLFSELSFSRPTTTTKDSTLGDNILSFETYIDAKNTLTSAKISDLCDKLAFTNYPALLTLKCYDYLPVVRNLNQENLVPKYVFDKVRSTNVTYDFKTEFAQEYNANDQFYNRHIHLSINDSVLIEKSTRFQSASKAWRVKRRQLITSSVFKKYSSFRPTTDVWMTHVNIHKMNVNSNAIRHGRKFESAAIKYFLSKDEIAINVKSHGAVGLVIDPKIPFLGTSPDYAIITTTNELILVEVKCPFKLYGTNVSIRDEAKKGNFHLKYDQRGNLISNEKTPTFFQIQGQLNLCNVDKCYLIVFVPPNDMEFVIVKKDVSFFNFLFPMLSAVWFKNILPHLNAEAEINNDFLHVQVAEIVDLEPETQVRINIPTNLIDVFQSTAAANTLLGIETGGLLAISHIVGESPNKLVVTHLIIPKQTSCADSFVTENELDIDQAITRFGLKIIGWIHTHPTQTPFLSSVDLHTHRSYQSLEGNAIAIVVAPSYDDFGVYKMTDNGMAIIADCALTGFHQHDDANGPLFETASHVDFQGKKLIVLDQRDDSTTDYIVD